LSVSSITAYPLPRVVRRVVRFVLSTTQFNRTTVILTALMRYEEIRIVLVSV